MKRPVLALFVFLTALHVVPIWSVVYIPTGDGPTHIYNAWVLNELATGTAPPNIDAAYRIDWRPHPNWSGHVFMALAMAVVPPLAAEKLFITLIFATLAFGAWSLATAIDPRNDVFAFLVFPFTYIQTFVAGFYNFSLSLGLYLLILGVFWRRRDQRNLRTVAILASLLVLCYFTHIQATLLACAAIALFSLFTRRFMHLLAIVPVIPLIAAFGSTEQSNVGAPIEWGIRWVGLRILSGVEPMLSLGGLQPLLAKLVAILYLALIVVTLLRGRKREANLLGILALLIAGMMFWLPAPSNTRDLFVQRNAPFFFLTLAAWFTPRVPRKPLLAILTALAIANAAIHFVWFRKLGADITRFVRAFKVFEPETTLLPLYFSPAPSPSVVDVSIHAVSYIALEKRMVDYANYEPGSHYFPIALRDESIHPSEVEYSPHVVDIARHAPRADYLLTRGLADDTPQRRTIEQLYRPVHDAGEYRAWHRKEPLRDTELVLLPLVGTVNDVAGRWRIEQTIRNRGSAPVRVAFRNCPAEMPCDFDVTDSMPVASSEKFAFLRVPRNAPVEIATVVKRLDTNTSIDIPAPREREFARNHARIETVKTRGHTLALRVYLITDKAWSPVTLRVRSRETNQIVAERTIDVAGYGMFDNADLRTDFPDLDAKAAVVDVELTTPDDGRLWAFVTETDGAGRARVVISTSRSSAPAPATAPPSRSWN